MAFEDGWVEDYGEILGGYVHADMTAILCDMVHCFEAM